MQQVTGVKVLYTKPSIWDWIDQAMSTDDIALYALIILFVWVSYIAIKSKRGIR